MFSKRLQIFGFVMALGSAVGCGNSSENTPAPETAPTAAEPAATEPAAAEPAPEKAAAGDDTNAAEADSKAIPEGSKFACHLNCSGTESTSYGATEEEGRANARKLVEKQCRPEDGQYFLVCEALK